MALQSQVVTLSHSWAYLRAKAPTNRLGIENP